MGRSMDSICKNCGAPCRGKLCEKCLSEFQKLSTILSDDSGATPKTTTLSGVPPNSTSTSSTGIIPTTTSPASVVQKPSSVGIVCQCFYCGLEGV